jgi:hypothetical protein
MSILNGTGAPFIRWVKLHALRPNSQLVALLKFHVDSTKREAKNLCKRGQLSTLRQIAEPLTMLGIAFAHQQ